MTTAWPLHRIGATLLAIVGLGFAGLILGPIAMALPAEFWRAEPADGSGFDGRLRPE